MPHRNRTLMVVISLIWIVALAGTLVSAAARAGGGGEHQHEGQSHSAVLLVEAPAPVAANHHAALELLAPGEPPG